MTPPLDERLKLAESSLETGFPALSATRREGGLLSAPPGFPEADDESLFRIPTPAPVSLTDNSTGEPNGTMDEA